MSESEGEGEANDPIVIDDGHQDPAPLLAPGNAVQNNRPQKPKKLCELFILCVG